MTEAFAFAERVTVVPPPDRGVSWTCVLTSRAVSGALAVPPSFDVAPSPDARASPAPVAGAGTVTDARAESPPTVACADEAAGTGTDLSETPCFAGVAATEAEAEAVREEEAAPAVGAVDAVDKDADAIAEVT